VEPPLVRLVFRADGFLYHMVRIMAGTLIEVGLGRLEPDAVREIVAARDRRRAGPTAPPHGLCLEEVEYDLT
jgi:tRNA pseudouridine38-40 synthase